MMGERNLMMRMTNLMMQKNNRRIAYCCQYNIVYIYAYV